MVDVFISYSRSDEAKVATLARAVEAAGYDVWWDAELPPHQSYGEVITAKIEQAKAAIVLWSATAVKSEWVRAEADLARHHRKLIQTTVGDVIPPLPFNQIQFAEIGDWQGEPDHPGWRKVLVSLADLCGRSAAPGPRPIPSAPPPRTEARSSATPSGGAPRWLLFAGIGLAVIAVAIGGRILLRQRGAHAPIAASAPAPPNARGLAAVWGQPAASPVPDGEVTNPNDMPVASRPDMVFPDSSTRLLQPADVATLGPATLKIAWGEIFARKGFRFRDPEILHYFSQFSWYQARADQVQLNQVERQNVTLLREAEARYQ